GVIYDPPIEVSGHAFHPDPRGSGAIIAPDITVYPSNAFVPRPPTDLRPPLAFIPPSDIDGNPHARVICEVAIGQSVGHLRQKSFTWMQEQYVRAVISIKILDPRRGIREPTTGYFYRSMIVCAKLYRQGMLVQRWDFGNIKKHAKDPNTDPAGCTAENLPAFQINIPINEVFWDPPFPIPSTYGPIIPPTANIVGTNFIIDLYRIQREALKSKM
ncbi:8373_t:CDS:2, partial [Cetraspora pellucida]